MKTHIFHDLKGERKEQILITCDKNGSITGKAKREDCHGGSGITHLAFAAFVLDKNGDVLLTKRSNNKSLWAGFWDASVVSHVLEGETPETAAKRRGMEELGIEENFKDLGSFYYFERFNGDCENEYCHILIANTAQKIFPNPVEIDGIELISFRNLLAKVNENPQIYTPWLKLSLKILLEKKLI